MEKGRPKNIDLLMKQAQTDFTAYNMVVNGIGRKDPWIPSNFHHYLCQKVQKFIETETTNPYDVLIINTPPQHGKALEVTTPVLTTNGWKRHGELRVGDYVFGEDGKPKKVLATQTPYYHGCVELLLDTGESFICAREHEWVLECNRDLHIDRKNGERGKRHRETIEAQHIFDSRHAKSPAIKVCKISGIDSDIPIEPYLLGVWLGDGTSKGTDIAVGNEDLLNMSDNLESRAHIFKVHKDRTANRIKVGTTDGTKGSNKFRTALKENNLYGNKHIPQEYFTASEFVRKELLRGLMDTDGSITKDGTICEYCGVNERLVSDVFKLVRGLGYKCSLKTGRATLGGKFISKKYRVCFTPSKHDHIFNLHRKQNRIFNKKKKDRDDKLLYFVKSVTPVEDHIVSCITVEDGLYLAGEGLILTHNSLTISETLPSWYLGRNPEKRVLEVSYNSEFAENFGKRNRDKIAEFGKTIFGVGLSKATKSTKEWLLDNDIGGMKSCGFDGSITGRKGNLIIIDDPIKNRKDAHSETYRKNIWGAWRTDIKSRFHSGTKVIIIMTRWHEDDLAGRLIKTEKYLEVINLPIECVDENDPLYKLGFRNIGDALCPEIGKDNKWVQDFKESYTNGDPDDEEGGGLADWYSLYQGEPTIVGGNLLKSAWWQKYHLTDEFINGCDELLMSVDAAFKDTGDPVAITVWGKKGANMYLIDLINDRLDFPKTIRAIQGMKLKYPRIRQILVEDKANGSAIIAQLRSEIVGIIPIEPIGGKVSRVQAIAFAVESGNVWLPDNKHFTSEFIIQCSAFPNGKHDDMVDSMSQALNRMIRHRKQERSTPKPNIMDFFGKKNVRGDKVGKGEKINVI